MRAWSPIPYQVLIGVCSATAQAPLVLCRSCPLEPRLLGSVQAPFYQYLGLTWSQHSDPARALHCSFKFQSDPARPLFPVNSVSRSPFWPRSSVHCQRSGSAHGHCSVTVALLTPCYNHHSSPARPPIGLAQSYI